MSALRRAKTAGVVSDIVGDAGTSVSCVSISHSPIGQAAFSLVEMIGVVAVIVIIAALVIPRISRQASPAGALGAVNQAQINEVLSGLHAIKTAATEHCARFGSLASRNGVPFPVPGTYDNYDAILLSEQLLERPFSVRLGTRAVLRLVDASRLSTSTPVDGLGIAYDLDGRGANAITAAACVLEAVVSGVSDADAKALNDALDGPSLGARPGQDDRRGKVTYRGGDLAQPREVHIYIMHR